MIDQELNIEIVNKALKIIKKNGISLGTSNSYTKVKRCIIEALKLSDQEKPIILPTDDEIEKAFPTVDPKNIGFSSGAPGNKLIHTGAKWMRDQVKKSLKPVKKPVFPIKDITIEPNDLNFITQGFDCIKIKHLSDSQLTNLEKELSEAIAFVHYANTEEHQHLVVAWQVNYTKITAAHKKTICKILNKYLII